MKDEKKPGALDKVSSAAAAGAIAAIVTKDPIVGGGIAAGVAVLGESMALKVRAAFADRFERWWRAVCADPTQDPDTVRARIEADLTAERAALIMQSFRNLEVITDDAVIPCLGALAQDYLARGFQPDRFFRAASDLLIQCDARDLADIRRAVDASKGIASMTAARLLSATPESLTVNRLKIGYLPGDSTDWTKMINTTARGIEDPRRIVHLLAASGVGYSATIIDGEAVEVSQPHLERLGRVIGGDPGTELP